MTKRFCMEYLHDKVIIRDKQRKGEYNFYTLSDEEYSAQELINTLNEQDERITELESLFPSKTCKWMDKENIAIRCDKYKDFRVCGVYKSCFEEGTWGDR